MNSLQLQMQMDGLLVETAVWTPSLFRSCQSDTGVVTPYFDLSISIAGYIFLPYGKFASFLLFFTAWLRISRAQNIPVWFVVIVKI